MELLKVPYLGTAEEDVVLVDWLVAANESFRKGQALLVLETLKASFEVEAETDGVLLEQLVTAGTRVPVHAALGVLGEPGEALDPAARDSMLAPKADPAGGAAPAARRRAAELGIDITAVSGTGPGGMVRIADVERVAEGPATDLGRLDPAFVAALRANPVAFAATESEAKVALYREHGARLGDGVVIGERSLVIAEHLVLGDDVHIGPDCRLEATEFTAGTLTHFGPRCTLRCRRVRLGDNAFFTTDIDIGGGGSMDPEAELVVGSHGFVGEHVHLNPCRPLVVGDEVVISRSAIVMTHSFGGSILEGYPNRFAGVSLGDGCQVGIAAVIFPGVEIGAGAIVMSGSSLVTSVPAGRLFGGVPARDLKASTTRPSPDEVVAIAHGLVLEFARQLGLRGFAVTCEDRGAAVEVVVQRGGEHRLVFGPELETESGEARAEDVRAGVEVGDADWSAHRAELVFIDLGGKRIKGELGPLASAFREFLRKRGVRLEPRTWAYRGGWL